MTQKLWTEFNLMEYEKIWFEKLETMKSDELRSIIDHHPIINQSTNFKYNTIGKFIAVLMGYNSERQELAADVIDKYWTKLSKSSLLGDLLLHAPFKYFKHYYNKARMKPEQMEWFMATLIQADTKDAKWVLNQKKTTKLFTHDNLEYLNTVLNDSRIKPNFEVVNLVASKEEVGKIVIEYGFYNLLPQEAKDLFLF